MTTGQVAPLRPTATRADQTFPTLTMAHIDRIAPARTSEALATFATGWNRCETRKKL